MNLTDLPKRHRETVRSQLVEREKRPQGLVGCASGDVSYDSVLEERFSHYLDALARSDARLPDNREVLEWQYHPMKFQLAKGLWYTPDFSAVVQWISEPKLRIYEVKGSWKSKNARDSRVRLEVAARLFSWFEWQAVTPGRDGAFCFEVIG